MTNDNCAGGTATELLLHVRKATFGYGPVSIVRNLAMSVRAGEVVALLGANGAGKTTTLLGIAGVLGCTEGSVSWLGHDATAPLHVRVQRGLGFVPGEQAITPQLNVKDNLRIGRGGVAGALELFPELKPLLRRPAGLLSGGEQKMLSLGRAIAARPRLLLVDEISLGLAPLAVRRLLSAVRQCAAGGMGVVIVEQQVRLALEVSHRAYVMRRGEIVMEGASADVSRDAHLVEAHYLDRPVADDADNTGAGSTGAGNTFSSNRAAGAGGNAHG
jgi:branched-chain amino acid transport system ATP-binding protein